MTFGVWLKKQPDSAVNLREAKAFATTQGAAWPEASDQLVDYLALAASEPDGPTRQKIVQSIGNAFQKWTDEAAPAGSQARPSVLTNRLGVIALLVFGIVFIVLLGVGIYNNDFLAAISKPEQARGLITFLFAFSTIAIFLLVAIATFWLQDKEEVKARFDHAKDLITIMIGVLGTILGFYFGSVGNEAGRRGIYVANVAGPAGAVEPGKTVELSGVVLGGTSPYQIEITFKDSANNDLTRDFKVENEVTADGKILAKVTVPEKVEDTVIFTITAADATNSLARSTGTFSVEKPAASENPAQPAATEKPAQPPASEQPAAAEKPAAPETPTNPAAPEPSPPD